MKKSVFVLCLVLIGFGFISSVSAGACSDPNQTILRLYSSTNAHGALWNGSYSEDVCYNNLFGVNYTLTGPHLCGNNLVMKLSGAGNAHAEVSGMDVFPEVFMVCYGDLICENYTDSCPTGKTGVARLSANANAHISQATSNPGGLYSKVICCNSSFATHPGAVVANWKNAIGANINLNNVSVNNTVVLDVQNIPTNTLVTFKVFDRSAGIVRTFSNVSSSAGRASIRWKITDGDMGGRARSDFYFNVTNESSGVAGMSQSLYVNNVNGNVNPKCIINSPVHRSIHFNGTSVLLTTNPNADDPDSVVTINWKIVDADSGVEEASVTNNDTLSYTLVLPGTKVIVLNVSDGDGGYCYNETGISVVRELASGESSRIEVFAWINKPLEGQAVLSNSYKVEYLANESYAYNITSSSCTSGGKLVCVAGKCPVTAAACNGFSVGMNGSPQPFSSLNFNWIFDGTSSSVASGLGRFGGIKNYSASGDKTIRVVVGSGGVNDAKTRKFTLTSTCERPEINKAWVVSISNGQMIKVNPVTVGGACEGSPSTSADDCCPNGGWSCEAAAGGQKLCQQPVDSAVLCDDYTSEASCKADRFGVGNDQNYYYNARGLYDSYNCSSTLISGGNTYIFVCGQTTNSQVRNGCSWDGTKCGLNVSLQLQGADTPTNLPGCIYQSTLGECIGGYQNVTTVGQPVGGNSLFSCLNENYMVLCGGNGVKLPFFGMPQFVVALVLIILIYYLVRSGLFNKAKSKRRKR